MNEKTSGLRRLRTFSLFSLFLLVLVATPAVVAQRPTGAPPPPPPPQQAPPTSEPQVSGYTIERSVDLVVLHVSVSDESGQFVPGLKDANFHVFEDGVPQKISVVRQEDTPVSMGLLIDNSASMNESRPQVNAAAITFVKTSNPDDEAFVAHFNENYSFDLNEEFTNNLDVLRKALDLRESRGATAMYDAVIHSIDHLKSGFRDKKVLLIVTDGEDNSSHENLKATMEAVQKSSAIIYAVGLLSHERPEAAEHARKDLLALTQATGGAAFFPQGVDEVESICTQIARDIRHQYTLAYYPTNTAKDGSYRSLRVELQPPVGSGKMTLRTRTGYFAQRLSATNRAQ